MQDSLTHDLPVRLVADFCIRAETKSMINLAIQNVGPSRADVSCKFKNTSLLEFLVLIIG
jgi:hypothetical protein